MWLSGVTCSFDSPEKDSTRGSEIMDMKSKRWKKLLFFVVEKLQISEMI